MSSRPDDHVPSGPILLSVLFWFNFVVLDVVALWTALLPFGRIYAPLNEGWPLPGDYAEFITGYVLSLVGPLAVLNLLWLAFAAHRVRQEPPRCSCAGSEANPTVARRGCAIFVVLLSIATCVACCRLIPHALWLPYGLYNTFDDRDRVAASFPDSIALVVRLVVALLVAINLAWMVYAICRWRTVERPPDAPAPTIPKGAKDHFMDRATPPRGDDGVQRDA
jgi:hypothetical protein